MAERIGHAGRPALAVVVDPPQVARRVAHGGHQPQRRVLQRPAAAAVHQADQPFEPVVAQLERAAEGVGDLLGLAVGAVREAGGGPVGPDHLAQPPARRPPHLGAAAVGQGHRRGPAGVVAVDHPGAAVRQRHGGDLARRVHDERRRVAQPVGDRRGAAGGVARDGHGHPVGVGDAAHDAAEAVDHLLPAVGAVGPARQRPAVVRVLVGGPGAVGPLVVDHPAVVVVPEALLAPLVPAAGHPAGLVVALRDRATAEPGGRQAPAVGVERAGQPVSLGVDEADQAALPVVLPARLGPTFAVADHRDQVVAVGEGGRAPERRQLAQHAPVGVVGVVAQPDPVGVPRRHDPAAAVEVVAARLTGLLHRDQVALLVVAVRDGPPARRRQPGDAVALPVHVQVTPTLVRQPHQAPVVVLEGGGPVVGAADLRHRPVRPEGPDLPGVRRLPVPHQLDPTVAVAAVGPVAGVVRRPRPGPEPHRPLPAAVAVAGETEALPVGAGVGERPVGPADAAGRRPAAPAAPVPAADRVP